LKAQSTALGASPNPLRAAIAEQTPLLKRAAGFSLVSSLLTLAPSWYMLEVYSRVVDSRSHITLVMLMLAVVLAYAVMEALELVRARLLRTAGDAVDASLHRRLFETAFDASLRRIPGATPQVFTDLRVLREFAHSPAVTAVLDAPASAVLLLLLFLLSPWLGVLALVAAVLQVLITVSTEQRTLPLLKEANRSGIEAQSYVAGALRNAEIVEGMGMMRGIHGRWRQRQRDMLVSQADASDVAGRNNALSKLLQTLLGSLMLGLGAWLFLHGQLAGGGGMIIVASILGGRVVAPLVQLVAQWRLVVNARDALQRLDRLFIAVPAITPGMTLPPPRGALSVEGLMATAPNSQAMILRGVSFAVQPGEVVAVVGPSAAGKTTLSRMLMGLWPAAAGKVRLDGADVFGWPKSQLGRHLGYLPQTVELFDGTIAENIARFGDVDTNAVRAAAAEVGLIEWIESLPDGFDTRLGQDAANLSGGQRQRVALARAVYGDPQLVVLDEPNASLDEAGEKALATLVGRLKARGATVLAITHRVSLLAVVDKMLVLREGQVAAFGPRDEVLAALRRASAQAEKPVDPAPGALPVLAGGAR